MAATRMAGVILGGGSGSRLGGVVKPLLRIDGEPILARIIRRFGASVSPLCLSIGGIAGCRFAGFAVDLLVPDRADVSGGPLAGLFATAEALRRAGSAPDWLLSMAGDGPDLPGDLGAVLLDAMTPEIDVVFAAYGDQSYPPNALWRFKALAALMDELGGDPGGRGPRHLVSPARRRDVDFAVRRASNPFEGINTLADIVRHARENASRHPAGFV